MHKDRPVNAITVVKTYEPDAERCTAALLRLLSAPANVQTSKETGRNGT